MENNLIFGKQGEDLAVGFLVGEGYRILERNWRFKHIEVDIIARKGDTLVIAEVKTRSGNDWGEPYTAVDWRKQRTLIWAAEKYIFKYDLDVEVRFDIISIISSNGQSKLEHVKDAFRAIAR
jgi:putative endonuclease